MSFQFAQFDREPVFLLIGGFDVSEKEMVTFVFFWRKLIDIQRWNVRQTVIYTGYLTGSGNMQLHVISVSE